jgi:opacity protein-like surface antigen
MRKVLVIALCSIGIALSSSPVLAEGGYIGVGGGVSIFHDSDITLVGVGTVNGEYDTGFGFTINGGGYLNENVRLEGEFGYRKADMSKLSGPGGSVTVTGVSTKVMSYMVNGYYDFKSDSIVTPFIGVGVGMLSGELEDNGFSDKDNSFGYQAGAGLSIAANKKIDLDLSYRFQGATSDFESNGLKVSYTSSNIFAGLRVKF